MKKTLFIIEFILAIAATTYAGAGQQQMQLKLLDKTNGLEDFTSIYFAPGTSTTYRPAEDAPKSLDTVQSVPQIYSFSSDSVACYSNGYGNFTATTVIALGIRASMDSTYFLSLAASSNFDATTLIILEDRQLGTFTNLRGGSCTLHIYQAGEVNNRFYLHVTFPPVITATPSGCNNTSGTISVAQDSSVQWNSCTLMDSSLNTIKSYNNISGNFDFTSLTDGPYSLVFLYNNYQSAVPAVVAGVEVEASISASTLQAAVGQDIDFFSLTVNTTDYSWQFGDSSYITGIANPSYAYQAAGDYVVTLTASNNYGCMVTTTLNVDILPATGISNINPNTVTITNDNNNLKIGIADLSDNTYTYELYSISGQILRSGAVTSPDFAVNLSGMASGIYLVSVNSDTGTYAKKIEVAQ